MQKLSYWAAQSNHDAFKHAHKALCNRPDFDRIQRLWNELDERFKYVKYDWNPDDENDKNPLYQTDLTQLAQAAELDDLEVISHLFTLKGAGLIGAVLIYNEFNAVTITVHKDMIDRSRV